MAVDSYVKHPQSICGTGGQELPVSPTTPTIYNVVFTTVNTEYSQKLPDNTKRFRIYAVNAAKTGVHGAVLKVAFAEGASSTTFIPIPAGGFYQEESVDAESLTLYFQSPTGGGYAIIVAWT